MAGYEQQDAHEFLIALLDGIGNHMDMYHGNRHTVKPIEIWRNRQASSNANNIVRNSSRHFTCHDPFNTHAQGLAPTIQQDLDHLQSGSNDDESPEKVIAGYDFRGIINELFSGILCSELTCISCDRKHSKFEPFVDISLSVTAPDTDQGCIPTNQTSLSASLRKCAPVSEEFFDEDGSKARDPTSPQGESQTTDQISEALLASNSNLNSPSSSSMSSPIPCTLRKSYPNIDVIDCLQQFTSSESLSEPIFCKTCQRKCPARKQLCISTPPNVLILHLKRFDAVRQQKIDQPITFPLTSLDLSPFHENAVLKSSGMSDADIEKVVDVRGDVDNAPVLNNPVPSLQYDLLAVITHRGSLNQGHYVAYIRQNFESTDGDGRWILCDDETTKEVDREDVILTEAYILFYINRTTVQQFFVNSSE